MGRLFVNIFSFDSRIDFQNGYVRCDIAYGRESRIKDILESVDRRLFGYHEFGVNVDSICCRINGLAVFDNVLVSSLVDRFGNALVIEPLCLRYCKKDLLVDFDLAFARYKEFFKQMRFITNDDMLELKRYLPLNFISTCYRDEEYCGDGFILYVKWLTARYPMHENQLLSCICGDNGLFLHVANASFIFPENNSIDMLIELLQHELIMQKSNLISKDIIDLSLSVQSNMFSDMKLSDLRKDINIPSRAFLQNLLDKHIA